jgi:hypothetical protein
MLLFKLHLVHTVLSREQLEPMVLLLLEDFEIYDNVLFKEFETQDMVLFFLEEFGTYTLWYCSVEKITNYGSVFKRNLEVIFQEYI